MDIKTFAQSISIYSIAVAHEGPSWSLINRRSDKDTRWNQPRFDIPSRLRYWERSRIRRSPLARLSNNITCYAVPMLLKSSLANGIITRVFVN